MTLYLNQDTGDLVDESGKQIGTAEGPPYTLMADTATVVKSQMPNQVNDLTMEQINWLLDIAGGDVELGTPPE